MLCMFNGEMNVDGCDDHLDSIVLGYKYSCNAQLVSFVYPTMSNTNYHNFGLESTSVKF